MEKKEKPAHKEEVREAEEQICSNRLPGLKVGFAVLQIFLHQYTLCLQSAVTA